MGSWLGLHYQSRIPSYVEGVDFNWTPVDYLQDISALLHIGLTPLFWSLVFMVNTVR